VERATEIRIALAFRARDQGGDSPPLFIKKRVARKNNYLRGQIVARIVFVKKAAGTRRGKAQGLLGIDAADCIRERARFGFGAVDEDVCRFKAKDGGDARVLAEGEFLA
jgi:hypothetical protein